MNIHANIFNGVKTVFHKLRKTQVEIHIFKPFKIPEDPAPIPFTLTIGSTTFEGWILRQDEARVLSKRGSSKELTVPAKWVSVLPVALKPYLIQIDEGLGLLYFSEDKQFVKGVKENE